MYIIAIVLVVLGLIVGIFSKLPKGDYHSRWSHNIPNFNYSTGEFYEKLAKGIEVQKIDDCFHEIVLEKEAGMFSASRKYFKISWKDYNFYMCAAPFGNGFFLSWWLYVQPRSNNRIGILDYIPFIGSSINNKLEEQTMYQLDTAGMFMDYCHNVMLTEVDNITKDKGITLSETNRKPILTDIYKRD